MNHLRQSALELALQKCASEPIHQLGKIQPYGAMLVLSADKPHIVLQASDNIRDFIDLPVEGALGKQLVELIGETSTVKIERLIATANVRGTAVDLISVSQQARSVDLDVYLHGVADMWVMEISLDNGLPKRDQLGELLMNTQNSMLSLNSNTETMVYFEQITQLILDLTGYDSVMVYRFCTNWDGEVIAQSCVKTAATYLGTRFPASDIPPQARLLYTKNLIRIVADISAVPVPVFPEQNPVTKLPLDMTYSMLRSLSPIHLKYLGNMGVQASMSISLLQNGQLWGLIACHHLTPKRISFAMREAMVFISRMISTRLTSMLIKSESELYKKIASIKIELLKLLLTQSVEQALNNLSADLLDVIDASGMIVIVGGQYFVYGLVPEALAIDALLNWLGKQTISEVYSCDNLLEQFPPASFYSEIVSGLIMTTLASDRLNGIIWLRKEKLRTVKWAGIYESGLVQNKDGTAQLNPRDSFKNWSELWKGKSEAWSESEIAIVKAFGTSLIEALALKHSAIRLEKERNEARDRLKKIASQLPGMVYQFYLHSDGRSSFPYASEGSKDIYRLAPEEICEDANKVLTLIHPDDLDEVWAAAKKSAQDLQSWKHEYRIKFDDGSIRWLYGNAIPQQERDNNGGILWHGFITDITDRRLLEENLSDSHALNVCILDSLTSNISVVDNQGVIISVNKAWIDFGIENNLSNSLLNMVGYNYLDACHNFSNLPNGKEAIQVHSGVTGVLMGALPSFTLEYPCNSPTQERRFILKVSPLTNIHGVRWGAVISHDDITDSKYREQQDKEHLDQLAHVTRLGLMGEMASGIAHEVNQPLSAIATYSQVSLNLIKNENLDLIKLAEVIIKTQEQALRAGQIIHRMKRFCTTKAQQRSTIEINYLIKYCVELCADYIKQSNVVAKLELSDNLPLFHADHIQIEQVIINLIRNSIDAIVGVTDRQQGEITIQSHLTLDNEIQVSVNDNGPGIHVDQKPKILNPFHTTKENGMGMGLSISRSLIEAHNGTLSFNSEFGKGSSFYFKLPI